MSDITALEVLLAEGAEWPSSFIGEQLIRGTGSLRSCWDCDAVAWALSKGYSWGEWRCQDLAPGLYTDEDNRADAVDLFEWAHENDCPCTCEAEAADDTVAA